MFDRLVTAGRLGHAYLLVGPPGVGKTTVARWIAQRVLCERSQKLEVRSQKSGVPCGACDACGAVERGTHPDVLRLSGDGVRTVESVREWTASLTRSSLFGGWKVGIVEGAEQMNAASANACLKAIEEPTPRTVIVLTAPNRRAVLPTIASRCAVVFCRCPTRAAPLGTSEQRDAHEQRTASANALLTGTVVERLRRVESFTRALPSDRAAANERTMELMRGFRAVAQATAVAQRTRPEWVRWQQLLAAAPQYLAANVNARMFLETIALTYPTL